MDRFGPTGSVEKTGPPFEVNHSYRSDRSKFWLNGSRPLRIHHQTRSRTLYKLIYGGIFYPAFFLCAYGRSFETASFCLKFWLFLSRRPRKLILSIFSKSKRPFEKQTTPRLVTYLCLSMDKIWAKVIFWLWPRNFDFCLIFTDICR